MQIGGVWSLGTSLVPRIYVTPNFLGRGLRAGNLLGNFFFFLISSPWSKDSNMGQDANQGVIRRAGEDRKTECLG